MKAIVMVLSLVLACAGSVAANPANKALAKKHADQTTQAAGQHAAQATAQQATQVAGQKATQVAGQKAAQAAGQKAAQAVGQKAAQATTGATKTVSAKQGKAAAH